MDNIKIGFIGAGNMARALVGGLIGSGVPASHLYSFDPDANRLQGLTHDFAIHAARHNQDIIDQCDVVVLAVKPQAMHAMLSAISLDKHTPLFLSIAAGLRIAALCKWCGREVPMVRAMPNTPALVRAGATGLFANQLVNTKQREIAENIMRAVGITLWLKQESDMDAVTALSGSGPAYYFYLMEAMEQAGTQLGLSADAARLLTVQTAFGAAKLALEVEEEPRVLRERVTSPGGTTERAISHLNDNAADKILAAAIKAARDRAEELARQLEQSS